MSDSVTDALDFCDPRIADEFLRKVIAMYRARAARFQAIGWLVLLATGAFIGIGIWVFVRGDAGDEVLAEEEVHLRERLGEKQRAIDEISFEAANAEEASTTLQRAADLAGLIGRSKLAVVGFAGNPTVRLAESTLRVLRVNEAILTRLTTQEPSAELFATIDVQEVEAAESNRFPVAALKVLEDVAGKMPLDLGALKAEIGSLKGALERVLQASKPTADQPYPPEAIKEFSELADSTVQLAKVDAFQSNVAGASQNAQEGLEELLLRKVSQDGERKKLEAEKAELGRQLVKIREKREKILFMSWIPGLTLRVGTVILLLFGTQILLATYRYTIGVSAFYMARSDAIQLLQPERPNSQRFKVEQLTLLAEMLTPSRYQIDPVKDPSDHFTELMKAWLAKR